MSFNYSVSLSYFLQVFFLKRSLDDEQAAADKAGKISISVFHDRLINHLKWKKTLASLPQHSKLKHVLYSLRNVFVTICLFAFACMRTLKTLVAY